jgi:hypothetical protein
MLHAFFCSITFLIVQVCSFFLYRFFSSFVQYWLTLWLFIDSVNSRFHSAPFACRLRTVVVLCWEAAKTAKATGRGTVWSHVWIVVLTSLCVYSLSNSFKRRSTPRCVLACLFGCMYVFVSKGAFVCPYVMYLTGQMDWRQLSHLCVYELAWCAVYSFKVRATTHTYMDNYPIFDVWMRHSGAWAWSTLQSCISRMIGQRDSICTWWASVISTWTNTTRR